MNKILIFIILIFLVVQNQVFATVQKVPEHAVIVQKVKPRLSFKQKVFTYLLKRKIRVLNAKKTTLWAQKGSGLQECVTITLKNGRLISATIVSMDDKNIIYKLCDQTNMAEGTVRVEQVAYVTDAQNRMIFNNQPKALKTGVATSGDKNAIASITALSVALAAVILAVFSFFSSFGNGESDETLGIALLLLFIVGMVVSLITGIMSLAQMAKIPPQKESSKFLAILSTIISGLFVALMLINLSTF